MYKNMSPRKLKPIYHPKHQLWSTQKSAGGFCVLCGGVQRATVPPLFHPRIRLELPVIPFQ